MPQFDTTENLKTLVTSAACLKIFDSNLPILLKTDASSVGLGAFLEQNYGTITNEKWHTIGYSSWPLWDYEKRYAQIEKETLSIVFGVKRFHEYLYGRRFIHHNMFQPPDFPDFISMRNLYQKLLMLLTLIKYMGTMINRFGWSTKLCSLLLRPSLWFSRTSKKSSLKVLMIWLQAYQEIF